MYKYAYNRKLSTLLAISALAVMAPSAAQNGGGSPALSADSSSINTRTGRGEFVKGVITYGDLTLTADSGSYVANEEWQLRGDVVLTTPDMRIEGDTLSGRYMLNEFSMTGSPITFEGTTESGQAAEGQAEKLVFDGDTQQVTFLGRSRLRVGPYELSGCDISYNLTDGELRTGEECEERFELRAEPGEAGGAEDGGAEDGAAETTP